MNEHPASRAEAINSTNVSKPGITLQTENLEGSQNRLLNKEMCEIAVISPEGQRWLMVLCAEQLRFMIVRCFVEEVLKKLVAQNCPFPGYTKDDVKLHVGGKSVDDECAPVTKYGIKAGSVVQLVRKVHGG